MLYHEENKDFRGCEINDLKGIILQGLIALISFIVLISNILIMIIKNQ